MQRRPALAAFALPLSLWGVGLQAQPRTLRLACAPLPPHVLPAGDPLGDGLDVDMAREAVRRSGGWELQLVRLPWKRALQALADGEADLVPAVRVTPERRQYLAFTRPFGDTVRHAIYARADLEKRVRTLNDLATLRVAVATGFAFPPALQAALPSRTERGTDLEQVLRIVAAGRADVAVVNELTARWLLARVPWGRDLRREPYVHDSGERTQMGVSLRHVQAQALVPALNRALAAMDREGWYARLSRHYLSG